MSKRDTSSWARGRGAGPPPRKRATGGGGRSAGSDQGNGARSRADADSIGAAMRRMPAKINVTDESTSAEAAASAWVLWGVAEAGGERGSGNIAHLVQQ